jgi:hypothetical protein
MAAKSLSKQEPRGQPALMSYYQNSMRDKLNCTPIITLCTYSYIEILALKNGRDWLTIIPI